MNVRKVWAPNGVQMLDAHDVARRLGISYAIIRDWMADYTFAVMFGVFPDYKTGEPRMLASSIVTCSLEPYARFRDHLETLAEVARVQWGVQMDVDAYLAELVADRLRGHEISRAEAVDRFWQRCRHATISRILATL